MTGISRLLAAVLVAQFALWTIVERATRGSDYSATVLYQLRRPTGSNDTNPTDFGVFNPGFQITAAGQIVGFAPDQHPLTKVAVLWEPDGTPVSLDPTLIGMHYSGAFGTNGVQQVGYGVLSPAGTAQHAVLWNGTAQSAVDLSPNATFASAYATTGLQQVGVVDGHAVLWAGTANSMVNRQPTAPALSSFTISTAWGTDGVHQVGSASVSPSGSDSHAMVWNGTAASAADLNPAGFALSEAYGVSGNQQVGKGTNLSTGSFNALLWTGTAD